MKKGIKIQIVLDETNNFNDDVRKKRLLKLFTEFCEEMKFKMDLKFITIEDVMIV